MYNTHAIVDEQGVLIAAYRKMHLFDVDYDGLQILPRAPVPASLSLMLAAHKDPFARVHAFLFCMCRLLCSGLHLLRLQSFYSYTCYAYNRSTHILTRVTCGPHWRPTLACVFASVAEGGFRESKSTHKGPQALLVCICLVCICLVCICVHLCASVFFVSHSSMLVMLISCSAHLVLR